MRRTFIIGRLYRASPAELSHTGSDTDTEIVLFADFTIIGTDNEGTFAFKIEGYHEKSQNRERRTPRA